MSVELPRSCAVKGSAFWTAKSLMPGRRVIVSCFGPRVTIWQASPPGLFLSLFNARTRKPMAQCRLCRGVSVFDAGYDRAQGPQVERPIREEGGH